MPHGDADQGIRTPKSTFYDQGRFGRLFPALPGFAADTPHGPRRARRAGQARRDHGHQREPDADPFALIVDPTLSVDNPDNPRLTAGMTFLGQFLDHDMTFDPTSSLARTPGPRVDPQLPHPGARPGQRLRRRPGRRHRTCTTRPSTTAHHDAGRAQRRLRGRLHRRRRRGSTSRATPRAPRSSATRATTRTSSSTSCTWRSCASTTASSPTSGTTSARSPHPASCSPRPSAIVRWHYQWMVLHEFLPLTCGDALVDGHPGERPQVLPLAQLALHPGGVLRRRLPLRPLPGAAELPRELRHVAPPTARSQFFAVIFDHTATGTDPADLRGGCRAPRRFIDWQTFFDFGGGQVRTATSASTPSSRRRCSTSWASRRTSRTRSRSAT